MGRRRWLYFNSEVCLESRSTGSSFENPAFSRFPNLFRPCFGPVRPPLSTELIWWFFRRCFGLVSCLCWVCYGLLETLFVGSLLCACFGIGCASFGRHFEPVGNLFSRQHTCGLFQFCFGHVSVLFRAFLGLVTCFSLQHVTSFDRRSWETTPAQTCSVALTCFRFFLIWKSTRISASFRPSFSFGLLLEGGACLAGPCFAAS